ncbi:MAG: lytic transglycosylase domain-containing protein [Desulfobacteraceae bacterium]|nr:lytic transglycosylase domain-containing protein [Desulfobacteraceae bacterium]
MKATFSQIGRTILFVCSFLCFIPSFPAVSFADIFKYVDKEGVMHFTNVPTHPDARKFVSPPILTVPQRSYVGPVPSRSFYPSCNPANVKAYEPHIRLVCQKHGLDQNLVTAVIRAESAFDSQAVSPKGAQGLMQLMPGTSRDLGVVDPFDPWQNIDGGARYLKFLLNRFNNNLPLAVAAYNAGPEAVQKYGGIPPYDETQIYVQRVLDFYYRSLR